MQFALNETQQIIQSNARKFLTAECPMTEVRRLSDTAAAYDPALWEKMANQGFTGVLFSEEHGGMGLGCVELAVLMEEMGRALLPGPFFSTLAAGLIIDACGSPEQKTNRLAPICRGEARAALALLEGDATWSLADLKIDAQHERLSGEKLFVADAALADYLVVVGRNAAGIVQKDSPRLTVSPMPAMDITRRLYAVRFDQTPSEPLNDPRGLPRALEVATVALVAEMVGGMQRVLDLSVDYAKTRKQFGKPIGQFQAVQHQLADSYLETESARSAAYYAAWALQENAPDASVAVSIAKMYASDAARNVGNRGIQVHGGMGFTWENDLHLYYRRFKGSETAFGDATYHRERIARLIVDRAPASSTAADQSTDDHYARLSPTYSR